MQLEAASISALGQPGSQRGWPCLADFNREKSAGAKSRSQVRKAAESSEKPPAGFLGLGDRRSGVCLVL